MLFKSRALYDTVSWVVIWAGLLTLDYFFNPAGFWHSMSLLVR